MIRAGLTGGLASGKSFVGKIFQELGCHLVRADELGHRVLKRGGEAFQPTVERFGTAILGQNGEIDRRLLALQVFADPAKLDTLNGIVHPAVFRLEDEFMAAVQSRDPNGIAMVEAAILIETGSYKRFDRLILVVCSVEQQIERAMLRGGVSREDVLLRLERQMPLEEKRQFADYIIDNSGTEAATRDQTRQVYKQMRSEMQ